jgi:hypothetical protein
VGWQHDFGWLLLGRSIPDVGKKIHYVIAVVVVVSLLPAVISILRERREAKNRDTKSAGAIGRDMKSGDTTVKPSVIEKA